MKDIEKAALSKPKLAKESERMHECDPDSQIFGRTSVFRKMVKGQPRFSPLAPFEDAIETCLIGKGFRKPRANSKNSSGMVDLKMKHSSLGSDIQLKSRKRRPVSLHNQSRLRNILTTKTLSGDKPPDYMSHFPSVMSAFQVDEIDPNLSQAFQALLGSN